MRNEVSRIRRRKTRSRSREKTPDRNGSAYARFKDGHALSALYMIGCGLLCLVLFLLPLRDPFFPRLITLAGRAAAVLLVLMCFWLLTGMLAPAALKRNSRVCLLALMIVFGLAAMWAVRRLAESPFGLPDAETVMFLLPYTFVPTVLTLLMGGAAALTAGLAVGLLSAWLWDGNPIVLVLSMLAVVVTAHELAGVRRRSQVLRILLAVGLVQMAGIFLQLSLPGSVLDHPPMLILVRALASLGGALAGGLLALGVLPLLEHVFAIPSNITIMGFADLGHPLLQRLALQAPGSYHHSLVVANLAQAAAERIGADSLLARVASYYHDIGKLAKPGFFIENASFTKNPHDDLPANISRMIIINHVKEGLSLGLLHKLPPPLMAVIREHHGTSLISWFHHKALQESTRKKESGSDSAVAEPVTESHFRYEGPKPSTREAGIVCLADAVEAASRTLERVSPASIDGLVTDVVDKKILDGQLDNSDLSLRDVCQVKRAFVATLGSMLHARIAYPKDEDRASEPATETPSEPG